MTSQRDIITITTLILCLFLLPLEITSVELKNCKFGNVVGLCMDAQKCSQSKNAKIFLSFCDGNDDLVCCPMMERIVVPNPPIPPATAIPTLPPPPALFTTLAPPPPPIPVPVPTTTTLQPPFTIPPTSITPPAPELSTMSPATSALPIIEVTTKIAHMAAIIATQKCEEYKHKVVKRNSIVTYVFGGTESSVKEFPHMAALGYEIQSKIEYICGGSLISDQFVLTAAHCVIPSTNYVGNVVRVRLGELDMSTNLDDADPQDYGIIEQYIHPSYNNPQQYNDIALLKLDRQVDFNEYIAPICLETMQNLPNSNFIATGWGTTDLKQQQSQILMKVDLDYFPNDVCRQNYAMISPESLPYGILDESQICAGSYTEEKDTCQGDSGGPLQIRNVDTLYLVGITSFGKACGEANSPAVYTRISYFLPWIQGIVWPSS